MLSVRPTNLGEVVAVLCADLHLCARPPSARAGEKSWYDTMLRAIRQLRGISREHRAPILCAGDVFDQWDSPPELINWALRHLPRMTAIPGNHDLPHHRPELMHRSAFGTLVEAQQIAVVDEQSIQRGMVRVSGRILGEEVPIPPDADGLKVLLTHEYLWVRGHGYMGAPRDHHLSVVADQYKGWDVVVVGDNHSPFSRRVGDTLIYNCGGFFRRRVDEREHRPSVGLLHASGAITRQYLDCSRDVLEAEEIGKSREAEERAAVVDEFVRGLAEGAALEAEELSFREAITRAMLERSVSEGARRHLITAMGE